MRAVCRCAEYGMGLWIAENVQLTTVEIQHPIVRDSRRGISLSFRSEIGLQRGIGNFNYKRGASWVVKVITGLPSDNREIGHRVVKRIEVQRRLDTHSPPSTEDRTKCLGQHLERVSHGVDPIGPCSSMVPLSRNARRPAKQPSEPR